MKGVTDSPRRSLTSLALDKWQLFSTRLNCLLAEQVLNTIRKLLLAIKVCMSLLYPDGYYFIMVILVFTGIIAWQDY